MWDFVTMIPAFYAIFNSVDWSTIGWGLFIVSEALGGIAAIQANSVYQAIYNFLLRFKR